MSSFSLYNNKNKIEIQFQGLKVTSKEFKKSYYVCLYNLIIFTIHES